MSHPQTKSLGIGRLRLDGDTQSREKLDEQTVAAYASDIEAGAKFPPVDVFFDETDYWLADGFHQIAARKKLGNDRITCRVHNGTREDARWYAYSANQAHGLPRTNADKRKAVVAALKHPNGAKMSDGKVAEHVGVSDRFVAKIRAELTPNRSESDTREGKDGRTIGTANIGSRPPESEPEASANPPEALEPATDANTPAPPIEPETEPDHSGRGDDGPLSRCGCVEESPVVDEEGPSVAPASTDSQEYLDALDAVMDALDGRESKLTPEEWTRLRDRVNDHFRLFGTGPLAETDEAAAPKTAAKKKANVAAEFEELRKQWNAIDGICHIDKATQRRLIAFRARRKDPDWRNSVPVALAEVAASDFHRGGGPDGWRAEIDWFLKPDTVTKLLERKKAREQNNGPNGTANAGRTFRPVDSPARIRGTLDLSGHKATFSPANPPPSPTAGPLSSDEPC